MLQVLRDFPVGKSANELFFLRLRAGRKAFHKDNFEDGLLTSTMIIYGWIKQEWWLSSYESDL